VNELVQMDMLPLMSEQELQRCETTISAGLQTYIEVGKALTDIRDRKGYRFQYGTFAEYVESRWKMSISSAYNQIAAAQVAENVQALGQNLDYTKSTSLSRLSPEKQRDFVATHDVESMTSRQLDIAIKAQKEAEERANKLEHELATTREQAESLTERANIIKKQNEELKRQKNPEPVVKEVKVEVAPDNYLELVTKNQQMNTRIAQLSGEMDTIRREYESKLRDVQDGDVKANRRELQRLLSEQLKALDWNHSSALFLFQRLNGNAEAVRAVRGFMSEYQETVQRQLTAWQAAMTITTGDEETWQTI